MTLRPGDVVTDEPTIPGIVVEDMANPDGIATLRDWDSADSTSTGRWEMSYCIASGCCSGHSWDEVLDGHGETRIRKVPDVVPADDWQPITADQVRVGDEIEVTREWDGGRSVAIGQVAGVWEQRNADIFGVGTIPLVGSRVTIRRRTRQPMAEPDAPAVVQHAGRVLSRGEHEDTDVPWHVLSGPAVGPDGNLRWLCWADLLALDPATDPVVVDLGGAS